MDRANKKSNHHKHNINKYTLYDEKKLTDELSTMLLLLDALYEIVWVSLIYFGVYYFIRYLITKQEQVLKLLLDIDIRLHYYARESSAKSQHDILSFFAASVVMCLLSINPMVRSTIYLFHSFVHVTEINRLIFIMIYLKIITRFDPVSRTFHHGGLSDAATYLQFLFLIVQFKHATALLPSIIQIIDDLFDIDIWLQHLHVNLSQTVQTYGPECYPKTTGLIVWVKSKRVALQVSRMFLVGSFVILHFIYGEFTRPPIDLLFMYYCAYRLTQIYMSFDGNDKFL